MDAPAPPASVYEGLDPPELWRHFSALNAIPRPPGHEAEARRYVQAVAKGVGCSWVSDQAGNLVVRVPARGVGEDAPIVAVQAHLDMVCERDPGVSHDFFKDAIPARREGDRITAAGTTLGADNGIGVAAALALLTDESVTHGPLELVFTVQEEVGLLGAMALDASMIEARMLVNLDSEDPDEIIIGSAGARDLTVRVPMETCPAPWLRAEVPQPIEGREIVVSGLRGGHSGVQIHEGRANALKVLAAVLTGLQDCGVRFWLCGLTGGSALNAIPRIARARLAVASDAVPLFDSAVTAALDRARRQWSDTEQGLLVAAGPGTQADDAFTDASTQRLLRLLDRLPHGVLAMSSVFPGKVETSCNLASAAEGLEGTGEIALMMNARSFHDEGLSRAESEVRSLVEAEQAALQVAEAYPAWAPLPDSKVVRLAIKAYREALGREPRVQVIHAGLECGVVAARVPGLEAVSLGPLICNPHSPAEFVDAPTVASMWECLVVLLRRVAEVDVDGPTT